MFLFRHTIVAILVFFGLGVNRVGGLELGISLVGGGVGGATVTLVPVFLGEYELADVDLHLDKNIKVYSSVVKGYSLGSVFENDLGNDVVSVAKYHFLSLAPIGIEYDGLIDDDFKGGAYAETSFINYSGLPQKYPFDFELGIRGTFPRLPDTSLFRDCYGVLGYNSNYGLFFLVGIKFLGLVFGGS